MAGLELIFHPQSLLFRVEMENTSIPSLLPNILNPAFNLTPCQAQAFPDPIFAHKLQANYLLHSL